MNTMELVELESVMNARMVLGTGVTKEMVLDMEHLRRSEKVPTVRGRSMFNYSVKSVSEAAEVVQRERARFSVNTERKSLDVVHAQRIARRMAVAV